MFCTSCGKEIIDTARFCNYCGRPVQNIAPSPYQSQNIEHIHTPEQNNTAIQPEPAKHASSGIFNAFSEDDSDVTAAADTLNFEAVEPTASEKPDIPGSEPFISEKTPETEIISQQTSANKTFYAEAEPYPTPGTIPKSGGSYSGMYSMPMPDTTVNITAENPASSPKRERKYTLGHILLCLASTAVMAIAAGVFAGLYFSVV